MNAQQLAIHVKPGKYTVIINRQPVARRETADARCTCPTITSFKQQTLTIPLLAGHSVFQFDTQQEAIVAELAADVPCEFCILQCQAPVIIGATAYHLIYDVVRGHRIANDWYETDGYWKIVNQDRVVGSLVKGRQLVVWADGDILAKLAPDARIADAITILDSYLCRR